MGFKYCNTNGKSIWTARGTNIEKPHLVTFYESILVSLWTFQLTFVLFITVNLSSSSSCCAADTDLPNPLLPPISTVHHSRTVFQATSGISTELLYIGSCWLSSLCLSVCRGPPEYIAYELILTSPAVSCMSGWSNLDSFCDGWLVAIQLLFCRVLPPGFVQYSSQHSCVITIELFLYTFS